jgi:hypothetical protein
VDLTTSSDDAEESKPAPEIFEIVLKKPKIVGGDAVAIGDTPYTMPRQRGGRISGHRRALRRVHRELATTSRMRRDISRTGRAVRSLRELHACEQNDGSFGGGPPTRNHYTFGSRSNMDANETFKTLHISNRRDALTRLMPFSYF